jgi:hypothetical protein
VTLRIAGLSVAAVLALPSAALAETDVSGGAAAPTAAPPVAQTAAAPAPTTPGHEKTGIVDLSGKKGTKNEHSASKPAAKPKTTPVATAPAPVAAPRAAPRIAGTDGLPYTGGSPILGGLAGIGFLMLGAGLRLRYGSPFSRWT